jgi:hypothetical protein
MKAAVANSVFTVICIATPALIHRRVHSDTTTVVLPLNLLMKRARAVVRRTRAVIGRYLWTIICITLEESVSNVPSFPLQGLLVD